MPAERPGGSLRVILGVTGGIAAYKAALVLRLLTEAGHRVRVVPTEAALRMVGAPTWEALSHEPVHTGVFDDPENVEHVALGRSADLMIVAPATAHTLARAAAGQADDLLAATLLTVTCPVLVAPAMHTEMWQHPATVANVATLRARSVRVLDPDSGRLTGTDTGAGRFPEPARVVEAALALVEGGRALAGRRVAVSAGGTREPLDPVRFLGNRSSGRQGVAIAAEAARRGADVVLAAANVEQAVLAELPAGVDVRAVETTLELREVVRHAAREADVVVMAAAVADFRPVRRGESKIKKVEGESPAPIELELNPDILAELAADRLRENQVVVGFGAETGDEAASFLDHGRAKARRKGADLLAVNRVGEGVGFGDVANAVTILDGRGEVVAEAVGSKSDVAAGLLDAVTGLLTA